MISPDQKPDQETEIFARAAARSNLRQYKAATALGDTETAKEALTNAIRRN